LLGACPQTPWVGFAEVFCEAELTLLLLFWKRRKPRDNVDEFGVVFDEVLD
jgi:hypothetical protein